MQQRFLPPPEKITFKPVTRVFTQNGEGKEEIKVTAECVWRRKFLSYGMGKDEQCGDQYTIELYEDKPKGKKD